MRLAFGGHLLDTATRQLLRGETEVHLSPKAFDLLQALVENRSRAISKAELHDRLWPGLFVTEANIASLVAEVRRALADPPRAPKFVRTVHRFGYAFCGAIAADPAVLSAGQSCWLVYRGREIALRDGENVIGRDEAAEVRIDAPSVSRRHARIVVSPDAVTLEDLGSKNGTSLGEQAIVASAPLADLDEVHIGSVRMVVRIMRSGSPTETVENGEKSSR